MISLYKVVIKPRAVADIDAIHDYIAADFKQAADAVAKPGSERAFDGCPAVFDFFQS